MVLFEWIVYGLAHVFADCLFSVVSIRNRRLR